MKKEEVRGVTKMINDRKIFIKNMSFKIEYLDVDSFLSGSETAQLIDYCA
jgi:hypothetical protein